MEKNKIENYIKTLTELNDKLNLENDTSDDLSDSFIENISNVLKSLNDDVVQEMTQKVNVTPKLKVRFKKLRPDAIKPTYAKVGDAGLDITATHIISDTEFQVIYGTGIAIEIPKGYVGCIFPRSSIRNYGLTLSNSVGIIDSGFRGEIIFTFNKLNGLNSLKYNIQNRIGQLIIIPFPTIELVESDELSESERNDGGFGHTGV